MEGIAHAHKTRILKSGSSNSIVVEAQGHHGLRYVRPREKAELVSNSDPPIVVLLKKKRLTQTQKALFRADWVKVNTHRL